MRLTQSLTQPLTRKTAGVIPTILSIGRGIVFPWTGAAADLDFVRRQYYWNGAIRTEANFTTLVLNGATWGAQGLDFSTCSVNPDITITLAALGITMPPCVYAYAGVFVSAPASVKTILEFDDGTDNEKFFTGTQVGPNINTQTIDGGVQQSVVNIANTVGVRYGFANSAQLNEILCARNGAAGASDVAATMPTVTRLKLGAGPSATTFAPAIISRLWIFTAVKTQPQVNQLSIDIRDAA
jgi:hypothetical protein